MPVVVISSDETISVCMNSAQLMDPKINKEDEKNRLGLSRKQGQGPRSMKADHYNKIVEQSLD